MRTPTPRIVLAAFTLSVAACSGPRPLPPYEKPIARAAVQTVRTTAYTHSEDDHVQYGNRNALGGTLKHGQMNSAAADWSRWPAGTVFRIRETGEVFEVDDYGWALAGTNTVDLYKPSRAAMNAWGVRRVTIENLRWGDPHRSLALLRQRSKYAHIRRMRDDLEKHPSITGQSMETVAPMMVASPSAVPIPVAPPMTRAEPVPTSRPAISGEAGVTVSSARPGVANNPFFGNSAPR